MFRQLTAGRHLQHEEKTCSRDTLKKAADHTPAGQRTASSGGRAVHPPLIIQLYFVLLLSPIPDIYCPSLKKQILMLRRPENEP